MINICKEGLGGLVSSWMKFQMTYICRDEMHILAIQQYIFQHPIFPIGYMDFASWFIIYITKQTKTKKQSCNNIQMLVNRVVQ